MGHGRNRKDYQVMKLKPCPFCGHTPTLEIIPMWHGSHGYHGCHQYDIRCKNCGCRVGLGENSDIYISSEEAMNNAIKKWNRRAKHGD